MWAAISYLLLAIIFIFMGWQVSPSYFSVLFYWTALSLLLVSGAYFFNLAKIFRKRENGVIPFLYPLGIHSFSTWCTSVQCMES